MTAERAASQTVGGSAPVTVGGNLNQNQYFYGGSAGALAEQKSTLTKHEFIEEVKAQLKHFYLTHRSLKIIRLFYEDIAI